MRLSAINRWLRCIGLVLILQWQDDHSSGVKPETFKLWILTKAGAKRRWPMLEFPR